eukprot:TRINITY_DN81_c0_g3_i1.p1 TRINITY_DN81_c0_g3~~TRINITY_DN81_c0_g3_i1.p1  ORF type:complete len:1109 (+),score=279.52 TRINITY_DN81_c0_g3_i1:87-3413(+)
MGRYFLLFLFILSLFYHSNLVFASTLPLGCINSKSNTGNVKLTLELDANTPFKCIDVCRNISLNYRFAAVGGNSAYTCSCATDFDDSLKKRTQSFYITSTNDYCSDVCPGDKNSLCGLSGGGFDFRFWYFEDEEQPQGGWELLLSRGREDDVNSDRYSINQSETPKARSGHTLFNLGENSTVLFGGRMQTYYSYYNLNNTSNNDEDNSTGYQYEISPGMTFNDVWSFNLISKKWSVLHDGSGEAPWPRYGHTGAAINSTSIVIFGGFTTQFNRTCSELWIFHTDTKQWKLLSNDSQLIPPRANSAGSMLMVSDEILNKIFPNSRRNLEVFTIFGGNKNVGPNNSHYYDDFWAWSFELNAWAKLPTGPERREGHSLVQHSSPFILTLSMGQGGSLKTDCQDDFYKMDVWSFNGKTLIWTLLTDGIGPWDSINVRWQSDVPTPRAFHAAATFFDGLLIYGGQSDDYKGLNDVWFFNVEDRVWKTLPYLDFTPYNRTSSSMVSLSTSTSATSSKHYALLFGGDLLYSNERNDMWMLQMNPNYFDKFVYIPSGTSYAAFGGIVLLSVWMCVIFLTLGNYIPRKLRSSRPFQLKNVAIPDREIFGGGQSKLPKKRKLTALIKKSSKARGLENSGDFVVLSDELVLHIFGFLRGIDMGRISRVCHRFNILCNDPYLWRELYLAHWNGKKEEENRNRILTPGEARRLSFRSLLEEINVIIQAMDFTENHQNLSIALNNNNNNINNIMLNNNNANDAIVPQQTQSIHTLEDGNYSSIELSTMREQIKEEEKDIENGEIDENNEEEMAKRAAELAKFKKLYIEKLNSYRKTWAEAKFQRIIKTFNTTFFLHMCLLLMSIWVWLVGIKLDRYTDLSWGAVFFPLWIIDAFLIITCIVIVAFWTQSKDAPLRNVLRRFFPSISSKRFCARTVIVCLCIVALTLLLWDRTIHRLNLWIVFSPLILIMALSIAELIKSVIRRASTFANVCWLIFSVLALCTALVVIAWAQQRIPAAFCLMLVPWWASDMIALMLMIVYIVRLGALGRVAGFLVYLFTIYLLTMVFLRIFLCLSFGDGDQCNNPRNFSWNLVFITLHVLLILFAFPLVHFMRGKFSRRTNQI